ncbi:unnamed protein product [Microthlaspi erraticum]|uniref:Uncharacterized protein n=1 Tax=Microthlaspi erraticum TaxID=1685480 RepID=A0A6D2KV70_9BRAS|nr:unnamed protein product [Microthlaspi erraticum]
MRPTSDPLKVFMEDIEKTETLSGKCVKLQAYLHSLKVDMSKMKDLDVPISKQILEHVIKTLEVEYDKVLGMIKDILNQTGITDVRVLPEEMIRVFQDLSLAPTNNVLQEPHMQTEQGLGQHVSLPMQMQPGSLPTQMHPGWQQLSPPMQVQQGSLPTQMQHGSLSTQMQQGLGLHGSVPTQTQQGLGQQSSLQMQMQWQFQSQLIQQQNALQRRMQIQSQLATKNAARQAQQGLGQQGLGQRPF